MLRIGSDFSGVGAFEYALNRLGLNYRNVFACDIDKYARQTYLLNHPKPEYYPKDVYERKIPNESLDLYMTSPPCQAFSQAGKRLGKDDKRGILFFNSYDFIKENKPRFFIIENVKGLLSHDEGRTFQEWINYLGGKSINGLPMLFPEDDAVPYHIYYKVINAKKLNVPQNRERVFIIGIREDKDNSFQFPNDEPLIKKLKDILQNQTDEKYFLSDKLIKSMVRENGAKDVKFQSINAVNKKNYKFFHSRYPGNVNVSSCINSVDLVGIKIKSANKKGYEEATKGDSINFTRLHSETRRGRVGKEVAQALECISNQATIEQDIIRRLTPRECFRLMDFPESFKWICSDSQAYKQAGNSIVVKCLEKIINNLIL